MSKAVAYQSKGEQVYRVLRDRVFSGDMAVDQIYTVVDLAEELAVSRTPVSQAVKILSSQGIVTMLPGVGFRVNGLTFEEINETLQITAALERLALRRIIQEETELDMDTLHQELDSSLRSIRNKDVEGYARSTDSFHRTLYGAAGLPKLVRVIDSISIHEAYYQASVIRNPQAVVTLVKDHRLLLEILGNRALDKVDGFLDRHVKNCLKTHEMYWGG